MRFVDWYKEKLVDIDSIEIEDPNPNAEEVLVAACSSKKGSISFAEIKKIERKSSNVKK